MSTQFISPNWHVLLVHFPVALLTLGVILEVFAFLWRHTGVRTAGRWMLLLGALAGIPAFTSGLYAFHDLVSSSSNSGHDVLGDRDMTRWYLTAANSALSPSQWHYFTRHMRLVSAAGGVFLLVALGWLAASDRWRSRLRGLLLVAALGGLGLLAAGAWYSGETIYRHSPPAAFSAAEDPSAEASGHNIAYYIPSLQLHVIVGGLAAAAVLAAMALSIRRWTRPDWAADAPENTIELGHEEPFIYPAKIWLVAGLLGVAAAAAGLWESGDWRLQEFIDPLRNPAARDDNRLFWHAGLAIGIIVLPLLLALVTRFVWRWKLLTGLLLLLLAGGMGSQLWLGALMLYDGNTGSLTRFTPPPPAATQPSAYPEAPATLPAAPATLPITAVSPAQ